MSDVEITLQQEAWADVEANTEALVDEWLVKPGDMVEAEQAIATVVVVKTSYEVVAPAAGVVSEILVQAGGTFAQGTAIGRLKVA